MKIKFYRLQSEDEFPIILYYIVKYIFYFGVIMPAVCEENRKEILASNIREYMKINHVLQKDIAEGAGINRQTLSSWICKINYPREKNLLKLAAFFRIHVSDLTEDHTLPGLKRNYYMSIKKREIFDFYDSDPDFQWIVNNAVQLKRQKRLRAFRKMMEEL